LEQCGSGREQTALLDCPLLFWRQQIAKAIIDAEQPAKIE
jgi:hypothetical protein